MDTSEETKNPSTMPEEDAVVLKKYATWHRGEKNGTFCHTCSNPGE